MALITKKVAAGIEAKEDLCISVPVKCKGNFETEFIDVACNETSKALIEESIAELQDEKNMAEI